MVRSLWTAASGMNAQQYNIDTISHNLSNVNTIGFRRVRAEFEDLIYQNRRIAGTPSAEVPSVPTGIQVGHGTKVAATQRMFDMGNLQQTGNKPDLAISGDGFFKMRLYDGTVAYTRHGAFKIDENRQIVSSQGYRMVPEVILPDGTVNDSLTISQDGRVSVRVGNSTESIEVGQIQIYRFVNPAGLTAIGENLFKVTGASGEAIQGTPGEAGMGKLQQGMVEMSNVKVAEEMVRMIVAQRAYEFNSKAIQTSDSMLGIAANLKR